MCKFYIFGRQTQPLDNQFYSYHEAMEIIEDDSYLVARAINSMDPLEGVIYRNNKYVWFPDQENQEAFPFYPTDEMLDSSWELIDIEDLQDELRSVIPQDKV